MLLKNDFQTVQNKMYYSTNNTINSQATKIIIQIRANLITEKGTTTGQLQW